MADILKRTFDEARTPSEQENINLWATMLVRKLSTLTWAERDLCFNEWSQLVNALNHKEEPKT